MIIKGNRNQAPRAGRPGKKTSAQVVQFVKKIEKKSSFVL